MENKIVQHWQQAYGGAQNFEKILSKAKLVASL